jgi:hypothetical protein
MQIMRNDAVSATELLECLERSGYLLESRIVRELDSRGYFVEPSQVLKDPRTGKSREIDLVAEHFNYVPDHSGLCVKTHFVVEVVNNRFPVVLLTPRPSSPNSDSDSYVKFGCTPEPVPFYKELRIYAERSPPRGTLFAQYCALTTKKGEPREFMASHSEDLYGSLQKLAEYVEQELQAFQDWTTETESNVWRVFFWHPILVVGGQLFSVAVDDSANATIREIKSAFLEFNWHQGQDRKTTVIEVIQLSALYDRMADIVSWDDALEAKLHDLRSSPNASSEDA